MTKGLPFEQHKSSLMLALQDFIRVQGRAKFKKKLPAIRDSAINHLVSGRSEQFSLNRLVELCCQLGYEVEIVVK